MNKRKIANTLLAGVLALAVVGIGFGAYQQKIQADTIYPGFATLHLGLKLTLPEAKAIRIKAVASPQRGGKRYYFKERDFIFKTPGVNNLEWYIRKIPAGIYDITVTSSSGEFTPTKESVELENDAVSSRMKFALFLGEPEGISAPAVSLPPSPAPTATISVPAIIPITSPTPSTDNEETILVPPTPQLPTQI